MTLSRWQAFRLEEVENTPRSPSFVHRHSTDFGPLSKTLRLLSCWVQYRKRANAIVLLRILGAEP